jgi:hypothetical protein
VKKKKKKMMIRIYAVQRAPAAVYSPGSEMKKTPRYIHPPA